MFRAFAGLLWLGISLFAQVTGRVNGSVVDPSERPVPAAAVNLMLAGGTAPVLSATTTSDGLFSLIGVRAARYDIAIEAAGFRKTTLRGVKVDPGTAAALGVVKLELGPVTETVEVNASTRGVQTSNSEISTTVTNAQVHQLPVLDRDILSLISTQPGVSYSPAGGATVINGTRTSYSNVTLDGINVQDNYIRGNGLDFLPNLLLNDQVAEFTITTSNASSAVGGGSSQVNLNTPSGSNIFRGGVYWYNRNSAAAANDWFSNRDGVTKPFLNQNQVGGYLGGRIIQDKLFFYSNYEAFRLRQQVPVTRTILSTDARNGIYTYRDTTGTLRKVNLLQAAGVRADPAVQQLLQSVPGPEKINTFSGVGDSSPSLLRNFAGYSFNQRDNRTRDNVTNRIDYVHSTRHVFSGTFNWSRDIVDRPDNDNTYSVVPKVFNDDTVNFLSTAWRWTPLANLTNEVRGGFNLAPANFPTTEQFPAFFIAGTVFSSPVNFFQHQYRKTNTFIFQDNGAYVRGRHNFQFGFHSQIVRIENFDAGGTIPTYGLGIGTGQDGLSAAQLPRISSSDLDGANALLATLGGLIDNFQQVFNVTSRSSGYVKDAPYLRHLLTDNYAFYGQDTWKVHARLTLNLGLRWEYWSPVDERDSLALLPVLQAADPVKTLLSNATLDFAGSSVFRPWYQKDLNNFAPNVGMAWDVFGNGKTALRAGYTISYVNDELVSSLDNSTGTNAGLQGVSSDSGLSGSISSGRPGIPVPQFQVPLTFVDDYNSNPFSAFAMPQPKFRTPYVQQWNVGIQHEFKGTVVEVRYVGNHGVKEVRASDQNQVVIKDNGFLADFQRAQNNGRLALEATGVFNPSFNSRIAGSQALPVFGKVLGGGLLTNPVVSALIAQGEVGELAAAYQYNGINGSIDFFKNPFALGTNLLTNYSSSSYHSLQVDVRRQLNKALTFQANYTFAKVLSDADGTTQVRFEPFLDNANPGIERARAPFDLRHVIHANAIYMLPIGEGHWLHSRPLNRVLLNGWSTSGIMTWQSGNAFSILSQRGTLNRSSSGRSVYNTAVTLLDGSQLSHVLHFVMTGNGPQYIDPSAINTDGRGVAPDFSPDFAGQVFFNPAAGTIGTLQRRMFSGPWSFDLEFGVQKKFAITEKQSLEFRMESTNIFNNPSFVAGDQNINSPQFGLITSTLYEPRRIQFALYYRF